MCFSDRGLLHAVSATGRSLLVRTQLGRVRGHIPGHYPGHCGGSSEAESVARNLLQLSNDNIKYVIIPKA